MADKPSIKKTVKTLSVLQLLVACINGLLMGWLMLVGELLFLWSRHDYVYANHEAGVWVNAVNNHCYQVLATTSSNTQTRVNKLTHAVATQRNKWVGQLQQQTSNANNALDNEMVVKQNNNNHQMKQALNGLYQSWNQLVGLVGCVTEMLFINMMLLLLAMPLFLLSIFVGLAEGLMLRSIRKASLGRESAYLFHQLSGLFPSLLQFMIIAFVVLSWRVFPSYFFVGMAIVTGCWTAQTVSRFKKYL